MAVSNCDGASCVVRYILTLHGEMVLADESALRLAWKALAREVAREVVRELPAALREEIAGVGTTVPTADASPDEDDESEEVTVARAEARRLLGVE